MRLLHPSKALMCALAGTVLIQPGCSLFIWPSVSDGDGGDWTFDGGSGGADASASDPTDGGHGGSDAGSPVVGDGGLKETDAGSSGPIDGGLGESDAGSPVSVDGGPNDTDAGSPGSLDGGLKRPDAGSPGSADAGVVEVDAGSPDGGGDVLVATGPSPMNGAVGQPIDVQLSWNAAPGATNYDVYFGATDPVFLSNEQATSADPGILEYETEYIWRVDGANDLLSVSGTTWAFTTALDPSLVGYWPLDEASGVVVVDETPAGNDGALFGGTQWVSGYAGSALGFDGEDDDVIVSAAAANLQTSSVTVAAWVRASPADIDCGVDCGWVAAQSDNWGLVVNRNAASNDVFFYYRSATTWPGLSSGDVGVLDDQWHHVAGIYDETDGEMHVYLDGVNVGTQTVAGPIVYSTGDGFRIGTMNGARNFRGDIDEVRVYNRALGEPEIARLAE